MKKRILSLALALSLVLVPCAAPRAAAADYVEVIPPKYDDARHFSEGLAAVKLDGKWGYIDKAGREVIGFIYLDAQPFSDDGAWVKLDDKWGFIDKADTEIIPCRYNDARNFSDGMALVQLERNGKWGYIDKTGKDVTEYKYDDKARDYSEGMVAVRLAGTRVLVGGRYVLADDTWGFIDRTGREVIECKYDEVTDFSEGLAKVKLNGKWGFIDKADTEIIPCRYNDARNFSDGMALVQLERSGKWGYIDKIGREVIECTHSNVGVLSEGMAAVNTGGKWGFIAPAGQYLPDANPLGTADSWAHGHITTALAKGFIPPDIQNNYANTITRAEFCRMAVKWVEVALGRNIDAVLYERDATRGTFSDTDDPDILAASALGITSGTGNGRFTPNGPITRQQAAVMITNVCKVIGADVDHSPASGFADFNSADSWAREGIHFVRANGIMSGKEGNRFDPKGLFTRQESIVTFNNIKPETLPGR